MPLTDESRCILDALSDLKAQVSIRDERLQTAHRETQQIRQSLVVLEKDYAELKQLCLAQKQQLDKVEAAKTVVNTEPARPDPPQGSEKPDEVIIVSGHLDSWDLGTGAIDDAAGVAVAMQAANLIKQLKFAPKRTIRVVAWMNEENGGAGGRTYFQNQQANVAKHLAVIESDLGAGHPTGFLAHVKPEALPMLQPLADILQGVARWTNASVGADISPLEGAGVPGFAPLQDSRSYFTYHHTPADTFDKVPPRALAENAAVMTVLAYALANLPEALPR